MVMQQRLLIDGCSFTYGLHLDPKETLNQHFVELGYEVTNLSRPGKSNSAIALDVYENFEKHDAVVVGWTFSSRWHLKYHKQNIDLLSSKEFIELPLELDSQCIEDSYQLLHKSLYSLFDTDHWNSVSDMLVSTAYSNIISQNKQVLFFSWEPRNVKIPVFLPHVTPSHRLPDGHLNADGTAHLFRNLIKLIEQ
jgi:hypothetical protein